MKSLVSYITESRHRTDKEQKQNIEGKKFDIVLMNPPYDKGLGERFFVKTLKLADKIITIQPMTWLFAKKQNKNITDLLKNSYCDITIINPNKYFDAGFLNKVSINYINHNKDKQITLYNELDNKKYSYDNIEECTELSLDNIMNEFNNIVKPLYENDNLYKHYIATFKGNIDNIIEKDVPVIRFVGIRGHSVAANDNKLNADFYTIISNNKKEIESKVLLRTGQLKNKDIKAPYIFLLKDENEQRGLLNYLMTDFCRGCLSLIKNNQHIDSGEMKYIPWFDFSDEHFNKSPREIDDWLFKKYDIDDKIRKHIEEILPDYYNIRKS